MVHLGYFNNPRQWGDIDIVHQHDTVTVRMRGDVRNFVEDRLVTSSEAEETLTLIPYGSAKLRITAFPYPAVK